MKRGDKGNTYNKITKEQRLAIIQFVIGQKKTIKSAAEIVGLGASTARMILRKFQRNGTIFETKMISTSKKLIDKQGQEMNSSQKLESSSSNNPIYLLFYPQQQVPYLFSYSA